MLKLLIYAELLRDMLAIINESHQNLIPIY